MTAEQGWKGLNAKFRSKVWQCVELQRESFMIGGGTTSRSCADAGGMEFYQSWAHAKKAG